MFLRSFNLKECITAYNQYDNKDYSEYTSFGFHFFEKDAVKHIEEIISCINNSHELCLYDKAEGQYIKYLNNEARNTMEDFKGSIVRKSNKKGGLFDNLPFSSTQIDNLNFSLNLKEEWLKWSNLNWKSINDKLLKDNFSTTDELYKLSILWKKHYHLARCNDAAIYVLAKNSLPLLSTYIKMSLKLLKAQNHQIPEPISAMFSDYLNELDKNIKILRTQIVETMLARLKAFDDSKGQYSSPVVYTAISIHPLSPFPKQPYHITPQEFNYFHDYIELYGDQVHKTELLKRSWYLSSSGFEVTVIHTDDNMSLVVPKKLSHLVPAKRRWPNWLFKDNLRQTIFKQSNLLFARLSFEANKPEYLIDIYDSTSIEKPFKELQNCESILLDEIAKCSKPPMSQIPWYAFAAKKLLNQWKSTLNDERSKLIEKKFQLAERLLNCLKSKAISPIDIPWKSYELLTNLSQELEILLKDNKVNEALHDRMFTINSTLSKYASISKFIEIIKKLSSGKLPSSEEIDYIHRFIDGHINFDPLFLVSFKRFCKPQLDLISNKLVKQLKISPFKIKNLNDLKEYEKSTIALFSILDKSKLINFNEVYNKRILKLALQHLQIIYIESNNQLSDRFIVSKNIILNLGKDIKLLGEPLINQINVLEKLKLDNLLLFKINSKATILTIGNNLLKQHFDKELIKFDDHIMQILKENDLSDETINILFKKRDEIVEKENIDNISLTTSEAKLLDAKLSNTTHKILTFLNMSAKAHQVQNKLSSTIKPEDKSSHIEHLSKLISENLNEPNSTDTLQKNWFSKQYVDGTIYNQSSIINPFKI